jgi:cysteine desulfurase
MDQPARASRVYLDHNASSPTRPGSRTAMAAALDLAGNASSVHAEGRAARALVEEARRDIAGLFGADRRGVVLVSGATEAANLAATPWLRDESGGCGRLLASAGEHPCVLSGHGFPMEAFDTAPLDAAGVCDLAALERLLAASEARPMLALQAANNETGAIQPVREAARLVQARGGLLVCDAVQWAGRGACRLEELGADALFVSSHKLGGPKGAGALVLRDGLRLDRPLIRGGGQERGARGGTENVAAIAGFAAAAREACAGAEAEAARLAPLRDAMEARLGGAFPDLVVFSAATPRLANTSAFALPDIAAETLLMALDMAGVAVSSGSACSSGKVNASHVLAAMGVDDHLAKGALRVSLGWTTAPGDIGRFCETFEKTVRGVRARRAASRA